MSVVGAVPGEGFAQFGAATLVVVGVLLGLLAQGVKYRDREAGLEEQESSAELMNFVALVCGSLSAVLALWGFAGKHGLIFPLLTALLFVLIVSAIVWRGWLRSKRPKGVENDHDAAEQDKEV